MTTVESLCDALVKAYAGRRLRVGPSLAPGLAPEAYAAASGVPQARCPEDLLALYAWRDGSDEAADAQLLFRDHCFLSAARAAEAWAPYRAQRPAALGFDPDDAIPVAGFDGALYVAVFGAHGFGDALACPVVSVYETVDLYFESIPTMLETCADWVRHPSWDPEDGVEDAAEQVIWRRHNPRVG